MRELEFLPDWYPQTRRRKQRIKLHGWCLILLILGLGVWILQSQRNVNAAQTWLRDLQGALTQSQAEQQLLDEQLRLRQQLQEQEQLIASLGYPVEMTRLLQTLDGLMPKEMSLTEFDCQTDEQPVQVTGLAVARGPDKQKQVNRRMKVKVVGVVPSDVDLANLLAGLSNVSFFEQVALTYSRGRSDGGVIMREFEVTFWMNLNLATGN
jgi:Fimbrial assembly protein (PilN)